MYFKILGCPILGMFGDCIIKVYANVKTVCQTPFISPFLNAEKNPLTFATLSLTRLVHWELI